MVDVPNSDGTISESSEKSGSLGVPLERSAFFDKLLFVLSHGDVLGSLMLKGLEWLVLLVLEVPDKDSSVGGSSEPLVSWVEFEIIDLRLGVESDSGLFKAIDVPNLDQVVFTTGGDVLASRGNAERQDSFVMGSEGVSDLEVFAPDLQESVPATGGKVLHLVRRRVSDSADPVLMVVLLNGVLALTFDVPQLDVLFATSRQDDSVVWVETAREDFFGVTNELVVNLAFSKVPKSHGVVPRG